MASRTTDALTCGRRPARRAIQRAGRAGTVVGEPGAPTASSLSECRDVKTTRDASLVLPSARKRTELSALAFNGECR